MARPIKKTWFGLPTNTGNQIVVSGVKFRDGITETDVYIIKQTGSTSYLVQDINKTHSPEIVFLANALSVNDLMPGQCFILATPFGGVARPCLKIAQYRLSLIEQDGSIGSYTWSTIPASNPGQADLQIV